MEEDDYHDSEIKTQSANENDQATFSTFPKQKSFSCGTEKKNLTSYSFVRNNETPQEEGSNTSSILKDDPSAGFIGHPTSQFTNQYDRGGSNFMLNFSSPPPVFQPQMFPPQLSAVNPMYQSPSPNNLRIAFQDFQYGVDPSPTNTGHSYVDPSPTAETLIPSFIKDEIDNKVSNPVLKAREVPVQEVSKFSANKEVYEENEFDISIMNQNNKDAYQAKQKVDSNYKGHIPNAKLKTPLNVGQNFPINSGIHQNLHPGSYDPKNMMVNMESQPMSAPQYMIPTGPNSLSNYNFSYQTAPGYMMHPMASQIPPAQNMQYYMNYQFPYPAPGYPNAFYSPSPGGEYLEQRRISMPVSYYSGGGDQYQLNEQPMGNQIRSNSMTDAMSFTHYNWNQQFPMKPVATAPPGFTKKSQLNQNYKDPMNKMQMKSGYGNEETFESKAKGVEMSKVNSDFQNKMNLSAMNNQKRINNPMMMAATGEISCHSNSTIKEEEFDSDKDCIDNKSDTSSSKASNKVQATLGYFNPSVKVKKQNYNSLIDDEFLKSQKRRESQQIPITSLDDKKNLKSPMKSTSLAFVPKQKDNRAISMPNIFQPVGSGEQYNQYGVQETAPYYQFGQMPSNPAMLNFNSGMMGCMSGNMSQNNDLYEPNTPTSAQNFGGLAPPIMPDYNYEERRNSGTTGGSSNLKTGKLLGVGKPNSKLSKKNSSGQYHNPERRSSNPNSMNPPDGSGDK